METRIPGSPEISRVSNIGRTQAMDAKAEVVPATNMSSGTQLAKDAILTQPRTVEAVRSELEDAVSDLNAAAQAAERDISFQLDDDSGRVVVSVTDRATGDVIRQIPSKEALALVAHLSDAGSLMLKAEA